MINEAIKRLTDEMMTLNHPFVTFIEEHLTEICVNEKVAAKLLNESKTLKAFLMEQESEMRKIAQKAGSGAQSAGLSDKEFYSRAEEYFGITEEDKVSKQAPKPSSVIDISQFL